MLLCHPAELLGTSWVLLAGLLVPLQQAAETVRPLERKAAAVGSSVLLPGPDNVTHIYSTRWEYLNGTNSRTILQYYRGSHNPAIHAPYTGRAVFHPSNGSLLLEDVQESDSGFYKVTVNVGDRESLKILLEVLKPVSRPQLRSSALVAQATGEVLCDVAEGRVDTITWKKDGQPLPPDRGFHLSDSLSILYLRSAKKSDCGSYSCNASNGISWQETSLNVTIAGLSPPLQDVLRIAVVAVVFAAVSGWGLIFPVCQSEKLRISESAVGGQPNPHSPCLVEESKERCCGKRGGAVEVAQRLHLRAGVHRLHPGRHRRDPLDARGRPFYCNHTARDCPYICVCGNLPGLCHRDVPAYKAHPTEKQNSTAHDGLRCSWRSGFGGADDQLSLKEHPPSPRRRLHRVHGRDRSHGQHSSRVSPPAPRHLPLLIISLALVKTPRPLH
ncbi:uncharacterized protein RDI95_009890 isoform 2-T4 [Morus bassanus]